MKKTDDEQKEKKASLTISSANNANKKRKYEI